MTTLTASITESLTVPRTPKSLKVAFVMSRFPKITETFVIREMVEMERQGVEVDVYPLQRERTSVMHPEVDSFVRRAHFTPWLSIAMLKAHGRFFLNQPGKYLRTLGTLLSANLGSIRYFAGAVAFFPKAVYIASLMRSAGVDHIHAHFASHPAAVAYVIHRLTSIPFSFVAHGSDLHRDQHMLSEKTQQAAAVIAISDDNRRMILDVCGTQNGLKVHTVHCGVDLEEFCPRSEPTPFERGVGAFQLLCIGTLHEVKGQRYLLEACRSLLERGVDFECHFAGVGPDLQALKKQAQALGLNNRVYFHGRCTGPRILELLRKADLLVTPSVPSSCGRREGIPVVLMEAMASGVPVVTSDLSGIPELVQHEQTGLLTQPRDVAAIAASILRLRGDRRLSARLAVAGRQKIESQFNQKINVQNLLDILSDARSGT
jgi:glycosyltransferase involved in cell wall biosynthesis